MRPWSPLLLALILLLPGSEAGARIAHADSEVFAIDTITAIGQDPDSLPLATGLAAVYPNPFNPRVTIAFELAADGPVELAIFDLRGRRLQVLTTGTQSAGRHQVVWDGLDHQGRSLPSGTYCCRLVTPRGTETRKLTLAR